MNDNKHLVPKLEANGFSLQSLGGKALAEYPVAFEEIDLHKYFHKFSYFIKLDTRLGLQQLSKLKQHWSCLGRMDNQIK